jgi:uncharacterized protein (DUF1697 family)
VNRYVAFLGGINVGGHRVSMERLRAEFEALRYESVSTFIASGNVVFETAGKAADAAKLEATIEKHLGAELGFPAPAFVRPAAAVVAAAGLKPFGALGADDTYLVLFLKDAPTAAAKKATEALSNETDTLLVRGRELHWKIHGKTLDTTIKSNVLLKTVGRTSTARNIKSLSKLADKLL